MREKKLGRWAIRLAIAGALGVGALAGAPAALATTDVGTVGTSVPGGVTVAPGVLLPGDQVVVQVQDFTWA